MLYKRQTALLPEGPPNSKHPTPCYSSAGFWISMGTAQVKAGDTVVVTAAAGGTGHFAVQQRWPASLLQVKHKVNSIHHLALTQIALAAGAHVIAVCGGATKVQALQGLKHEPGQLRVVDRLKEVGFPFPAWCIVAVQPESRPHRT
eukprot:1152957-Pelagomonas_calceolata.AAC.4